MLCQGKPLKGEILEIFLLCKFHIGNELEGIWCKNYWIDKHRLHFKKKVWPVSYSRMGELLVSPLNPFYSISFCTQNVGYEYV